MQLAIGAEENFGVYDLVKMKAIYWNEDDLGLTFEDEDIPEAGAERCDTREKLIEAAAEVTS